MKNKKSPQPQNVGMKGVSTKKYNPNVNRGAKRAEAAIKAEALAKAKKRNKAIVGVSLSAIIFLSVVLSVILYIVNRPFDYLTANLSSYLTLGEDDYKGYELVENVKYPTKELELEEAILQARVQYKSKTPLYDGNYILNEPIEAGSGVKLWYYGYYLDENGSKISAGAGTSNFASATASELVIGSGNFVSGFEIGLIGKNMKDYSKLSAYTKGKIQENDMIIVSMTAYYPDGRAEQITSMVLDLSNKEYLDEKYGVGFSDAILALEIGDENKAIATSFDGASAAYSVSVKSAVRPVLSIYEGEFASSDSVYISYNVTVNGKTEEKRTKIVLTEANILNLDEPLRELFAPLLNGGKIGEIISHSVTHSEKLYSGVKVSCKYINQNKPMTVKTYFPADYQEKSFRNKEVYFDVYVDGVIYYEVPELNEAFITDTLKLTAEYLNSYDGDSLVEKYKSLLMDDLIYEYEYAVSVSLEEAAWEHLMSKAVFKKLPEGEIDRVYSSYKSQLTTYYNQNIEYLSSIDEAAQVLFGFDGVESTEDALRNLATTDVKEKIVFYYIARRENLLPSKKEFEKLYDEKYQLILDDYLISVYCLPEYFESEESYLEAVKHYEAEMKYYYTEESITEALYYEIAMPKIVELAEQ